MGLFDKARSVSILSYLHHKGIETRQRGIRHWCSSPFSSDSVWSFCVYPNNSWYDWSTGQGGNIVKLVSLLEGVTPTEAAVILADGQFDRVQVDGAVHYHGGSETKHKLVLLNYIEPDSQLIWRYATSRGFDIYVPGHWSFDYSGDWVRVPSLLFVHRDKNLNVSGIKLRTVEFIREKYQQQYSTYIPKFNSRGELGWFILENYIDNFYSRPRVYIVESETSALALYHFFHYHNYNAVILSFGGVYNKIPELPERYTGCDKFLVIDYDGDEQLYRQRLERINLPDALPIRLVLPKGRDICSIYSSGDWYKLSTLIK